MARQTAGKGRKSANAQSRGLFSTSRLDHSDLELGWRRAKLDRPNRCFVIHPYLFSWIEVNLPAWLKNIFTKVMNGYTPHDSLICHSPKPGWMVRPGTVLDLEDEVVLNAILGRFYSKIWKALEWSQGDPDIAYQLRRPSSKPDWIKSGFLIWTEWRKKSLAKLKRGIRFVVFADIAGFYDNIDLALLYSDLNALGVDQHLLSILRTCLDRWSKPRGRGIPQGYSGSDILAKVYMGPVDLGLRNFGFKHVRYVDDIRIFCRSNLEAKRALLKLTDLLRNRGLILQTAKTNILTVDKARTEIDGVGPLIESIQAELQSELREVYGSASAYATVEDLDRALRSHPDAPPPEVLERAFDEHFSVGSSEGFNQTLLHYLLTRLGKVKSRAAVNFCLAVLGRRPEETEHVLRYLGNVEITEEERDAILDYAGSSEAIYDYQLYQIVRWFVEREDFPQKLVSLCRIWVADKNRHNWLRSYSLAVLGKAGDPADLEMIDQSYSVATLEVEKAEIVMALVRMEIGRRNAFYKRVSSDGQLVMWAVDEALRGKGQGRSQARS